MPSTFLHIWAGCDAVYSRCRDVQTAGVTKVPGLLDFELEQGRDRQDQRHQFSQENSALWSKRAEVHGRINAYQSQIAQAKHDLAHINAAIGLFTNEDDQRVRYLVSHGFFKKGEIADIAVRHLEVDGELTTREVAERVMGERKLDSSDTTLRNSVVFKVVQALRHAARRKLVCMVEKRKGVCVWALGEKASLRVASIPSKPD